MKKLLSKIIFIIIICNILFFIKFVEIYAKYVIETSKEVIHIQKADNEKPSINNRKYDVDYENFNTDVTINYNDNTGIKYAKYWFNSKEKVFENEGIDFENNTKFDISGWYKVEVSDLYDNKTSYIFLIDKKFDNLRIIVRGTDNNGSSLIIKSRDNLTGVQKFEVYISGKLYKTIVYDEWFVKDRTEELYINVSDLDFYGEVYVIASDFYGNKKTSGKYIANRTRIYDVADLLKFRELVNNNGLEENNVYLLNDINLNSVCSSNTESWVPIGTNQSFKGIFEGNNKTIYNLYINSSLDKQGLFGEVSGTIKNLTVSGEIVNSGNNTGAIAAVNYNGTIENCINNVSINCSGKNNIGGIVGCNYGYIKNSSNFSSILGKNFVGGIIGYNVSGHLEYCYNTSDIKAESEYAGGLIGYSAYCFFGDVAKYSYNSGNITANKCAGGICGAAWDELKRNIKMSYLYNTGTITGNHETVGGILGGTYYNLTSQKLDNVNTIEFAYNIGNINSSKPNQIAGGYLNYNYIYYIDGKSNYFGYGIPKSIELFIAPMSNVNSVLYGLSQGGIDIWTIDKNYNFGNIIFKWQVKK